MEYRELGKTREKVSVIGMGTWKMGVYRSQEERSEQVQALRRGIELGMNLIDTAEMYASGRAEEVVGEAIKGLRDRVFIATKVWSDHLHHDDVIASCKASLQRLGVKHADLYQIHWPDPKVPIKETMSAMQKLVDDGLVRYVGISNFGVAEAEAAREALPRSEIVSNQVKYSLADRSVEADILPYCRREKLTLIAYSPLEKGSITGEVPEGLLRKYNMTPAQAMLNWVTRDESVMAIPKSAKIPHIEENALSVSVRFEPSEYDEISRR